MKVKIKETVEMIVEADSLADAKEKYSQDDFDLDVEVLKNVEFSVYEGDSYGS